MIKSVPASIVGSIDRSIGRNFAFFNISALRSTLSLSDVFALYPSFIGVKILRRRRIARARLPSSLSSRHRHSEAVCYVRRTRYPLAFQPRSSISRMACLLPRRACPFSSRIILLAMRRTRQVYDYSVIHPFISRVPPIPLTLFLQRSSSSLLYRTESLSFPSFGKIGPFDLSFSNFFVFVRKSRSSSYLLDKR